MNAPTPPDRLTSAAASPEPEPADVAALLGEPAQRRWHARPLTWIVLLCMLAAGIGLWAWQRHKAAVAAPVYTTQPVTHGKLTLSVTANGTLQPTRSVNIGSELSGTVSKVHVDVNDRVTKGQVLVELDTAKLRDQILRSRATLASANAGVAQRVATVQEAQTSLGRLEEVFRLSGGKVPSQTELDSARAAVTRAKADEAASRASVADARAALSTDEINLGKASIRSPTDGVVLTRSVDPGNAVAASLQAVTLFTIAEDLSKLRLQVNVDEADVGSVKAGQTADFTVSAYPSRKYPAQITRVAFGSTTTDNVVTYVTYLDVDNADLSLRPGMTATATIAAVQREDALLVPNAALRFAPVDKPADGAAAGGSGGNRSVLTSLMPRAPGMGGRRQGAGGNAASGANAQAGGQARQVWVLRDGAAVPVNVRTGISDGRNTEVTGGDLQAGMQVITDQKSAVKP